jgi:uncharacterized protein with von Willebrand factor type A (vWA) domain
MSDYHTRASKTQGHLLRNIVLFGRLLRALGMDVTPTQMLDWVEGLKYVDLRRRQDVKDAARAIFVNHHDFLPLFDKAFDLFWQARGEKELSELDLSAFVQQLTQARQEETLAPPEEGGEGSNGQEKDEEPIIERIYTYSAREVLRQKDFAEMTLPEVEEVKHLIQHMEWKLEQRRTRRKTPASNGTFIDMRRTLRQNMRYGNEPLQLVWRSRRLKRRPMVVISDISGSMERYSRILLKFIYAISSGLDRVQAFVFSTRLTRITRQLKERDIDVALDQVSQAIPDWAGGTRIGDALKTFNYHWGRRVLGQGAIVLIISDGWDRGDIDLLAHEMRRLQLSCQRLIWLNPLLGMESYEPLTRGIQAALPHIDDFLPVHNLASLEQLGRLLEHLGEYHPVRRQHTLMKD